MGNNRVLAIAPQPDDEALGRLVADNTLRANMGSVALLRARTHFDESKVLKRQLEILLPVRPAEAAVAA